MARRVRFDRPPVVEVLCGVMFGSLQRLQTAHVGMFWDLIRKDFPKVQEAPPMPTVIERPAAVPPFQFEMSIGPPLARTWFCTADGHRLVQLQRDRFVYNWRRDSAEDGPYPSYDRVVVEFERSWSKFSQFVAREELGEIEPRQLELAYVNAIPVSSIPDGHTLFVDHHRDASRGRFLPQPESFDWTTSYPLPEASGRLHMRMYTSRALPTGAPFIRFETIARGINDAAVLGFRSWFNSAHVWIVNGFVDVTTSEMQAIWGRRQ
jgi:uncharacterized protein (TIGR04255 family)